ncbi:MAG: N-acyl homoserine lactonase family protein [bacterium]
MAENSGGELPSAGATAWGEAGKARLGKRGEVLESGALSERYEVYALKYAGPFTSKLAMVLWMEGWDQDIERNYYFWAIRSKTGDTTLVDTGAGPTEAGRRQLRNYVNPLEALARLGIDPEQVSKVIITHIHFDHVGGMEVFPRAFPKARFYVQKKEFDFWMKNPLSKKKPFQTMTDFLANQALAKLQGSKQLVLVDGDCSIAPGMELLLVPGHTVGLQAVMVQTNRGRLILASDCAHIHKSFRDDIPSCLITDMLAWLESYEKLRAKTSLDLIFPGHDVMMLRDFPKVAEDVTRLA